VARTAERQHANFDWIFVYLAFSKYIDENQPSKKISNQDMDTFVEKLLSIKCG
jgi:hypothetical protein